MILRFVHVPKTAGVSILDSLNNSISLLGKDESQKWQIRGADGTYHSRASEPSIRVVDSLPEGVNLTDPPVDFSFAFIRNPWDRFVSSYNYLSQKKNDEYEQYIKPFKSFKDFVLNGSIEGLHFRPQTHWIDRQVDFIGRFENLQSHFDGLCKKLGLESQVLKNENATEHKHYSEYYDEQSVSAISDKYSEDIKLLGYEFNSYKHPERVFQTCQKK